MSLKIEVEFGSCSYTVKAWLAAIMRIKPDYVVQARTQDFFKGGGGLTFLNRAENIATTQPAAE